MDEMVLVRREKDFHGVVHVGLPALDDPNEGFNRLGGADLDSYFHEASLKSETSIPHTQRAGQEDFPGIFYKHAANNGA